MNVWMRREFAVSTLLLPTIVYFPDPRDPYSVILTNPDRISEIGGPTAAYVNATVMVTDEPVTRNVESYLPWINTFNSNLDVKKVEFFRYELMKNLVSYLRRDDL
ncbi:hypothetical protein BA011_40365 (plasmid) [Rhizobium leguminosarum]|uniref:Uncharacterized protein n=2 Tax=Rhizobium leguminosarum TaxID=384 RepID=A0A1B1CK74_RHILE|nr:hypothetical protein BA011_40365 [Rhizobium leguminosarum]